MIKLFYIFFINYHSIQLLGYRTDPNQKFQFDPTTKGLLGNSIPSTLNRPIAQP